MDALITCADDAEIPKESDEALLFHEWRVEQLLGLGSRRRLLRTASGGRADEGRWR